MQPLVFTPFLRPMVWGGRRLGELFGKTLPTEQKYGESWEISGHPLHVSVVAEGPMRGRSLTSLSHDHATELFGAGAEPIGEFPLLVKFLDCQELLSIQVHPNDTQVSQLCDEKKGKTEAWVVMAAEPTARVYAGFLPGVDEAMVREHLRAGTLEKCLHGFTPKVGDCLFLEAGTVHAVGGGVVIAEVQQTSDATFRLYDWNRPGPDGKPRTLHVEQALQCIDWTRGPIDPVVATTMSISSGPSDELLVRCPYFTMRRRLGGGVFAMPRGRMSIAMVLAGEASVETMAGYDRRFRVGEVVLIPASCKADLRMEGASVLIVEL